VLYILHLISSHFKIFSLQHKTIGRTAQKMHPVFVYI
jgi:hypothetical protein